jgi:FtsP/CotA-like multicopper oxidase with cupredoxin domain
MAAPNSAPDYFAVANWANSPLPTIDPVTGALSGGMRKFVNTLPGLCGVSPWGTAGANELGQCLPVAVPDTTSFPGSDYYEISLVEYNEQMHSDLPGPFSLLNPGLGTKLRGYQQTNVVPAPKAHYLGPVIIAQKGRPVRVKFTNTLPTGAGGNLFIPTDTTYMGAGNGPDGTPYAQNRATLHLHGGNNPWISDGTPHQWTVPAQETSTNFKKGLSAASVPDMWFDAAGNLIPACSLFTKCGVAGATNDPGAGKLTFYWTNQQGGRLMFFHDHAYGVTRLNVYAGEAAGYLIADPVQEDQLSAAGVPGSLGTTRDYAHFVPLVIQDKTFVPDNGDAGGQLAATDPTWDTFHYGGKGNLWFPHLYMPNQNPADLMGANPYGRWDYGPWFWPAQNSSTFVPQGQPYQCSSAAYTAANPPAFPPLMCPGTPHPSGTPEGFLDTPVINGTAYPSLAVDPAPYRFRILNAANDRALNLQLYVADPLTIALTTAGAGYTTAPAVTLTPSNGASASAIVSGGQVTSISVTGGGTGYTIAPSVTITGDGTGATAVAVIGGTGAVTAIAVTNPGVGYSFANVAVGPSPLGCGTPGNCATATATVAPIGSIIGITVLNAGLGFTTAPAVTIAAPSCSPVAPGTACAAATAVATVNTEVKMVDALPHTSSSALPLCSTATAVSGANLALAALDGTGNPLNGTGLPSNCWPTTWPTDGRDGGVPDPTAAGPAIIQIGSEGGLLPHPVAIPSTPVGYEYNRRSITVLNVFNHGLLMGPAERADIVIDFSKYAGKTLILYNDAPTPVPAFDPRTDYYTGDPDQTTTGGAPSTLPGYGPNTRTIMQIKVAATASGTVAPLALNNLQTVLPNLFASTQNRIIIPETAYPAGNGGSAVDTYIKIQDTSVSFFKNSPVAGLTLTNSGSGYTAPPTVTIAPPSGCVLGTAGCSQATATASIGGSVASVFLSNGGTGYSSVPTVVFTGGGGSGASATAFLTPRSISTIAITNGGSNYTSAPIVAIAPPGCVGCITATATAIVSGKKVSAIAITNGGSGYSAVPAVTISGGGGTGAAAKAVLTTGGIAGIALTTGGTGYTSVPAVSFTGGGGSGASATAALSAVGVTGLTLTSGGAGYNAPPAVSFTNAPTDVTGGGASAIATAPVVPILPKAIQELFTLDYGRMNATLGVELPFTNFNIQTTIPYGYVDPPTEIFRDGETQLWKITHNGVDTHFIHFHLFDVQVVNRVGWDGAVKAPDANEVGWKDTVRMNPLEDIVVALRPLKQQLSWDLPNSIRPLDVTMPVGGSMMNEFTNIDPTNQPATVTNDLTNFGWEYVWHCHILGHEENDMMRAMVLAVPPIVPGTPVAAVPNGSTAVVLKWADGSLNETGFTIQRATSATGPWTTIAQVGAAPGSGTTVSYTDRTVSKKTTYYYRVIANNLVGYTKAYAAPAVGYPNLSADSAASGVSNSVTP